MDKLSKTKSSRISHYVIKAMIFTIEAAIVVIVGLVVVNFLGLDLSIP